MEDLKEFILELEKKDSRIANVFQDINELSNASDDSVPGLQSILSAITELSGTDLPNTLITNLGTIYSTLQVTPLGSISLYILAYDRNKNLLGNPNQTYGTNHKNSVPTILMQNIKNYLDQFKLLTDVVDIKDGFIINFGVEFHVTAHSHINRRAVKLRCIQKIKDYFRIEKMQFGQAIHISKLEYELMNVDGVKIVRDVKIVQQIQGVNLYRYSIDTDGSIQDNGTTGYGYQYDFSHSWNLGSSPGIVLPPHSNNPAVFELKNPNQNIVGDVN